MRPQYIWRRRYFLHQAKSLLFHCSKKRSEGHKLQFCTATQSCCSRWKSMLLGQYRLLQSLRQTTIIDLHGTPCSVLLSFGLEAWSLICFMYCIWLCDKVEHTHFYFYARSYPAIFHAVLALYYCFFHYCPQVWLTDIAEKGNRAAQYVFYQAVINIPLEYSAVMIPRFCAIMFHF